MRRSTLIRSGTRMVCCLAGLAYLLLDGDAVRAADLDAFQKLDGQLDIAGGTAHLPVMTEAAKRIMRANPRIRITIAGGGSGVGVQKVGQGLVDIGNTGRAVSDEERQKFGLVSVPFAIDGVAVIVHPENKVRGLTTQQARDIFAGKVLNWKDVGGADRAIHLYSRDEASGTREVFWEKLLNKGDVSSKANVVASNGAMKVAIGGDAGAIGYLSIGYVDATVAALAIDDVTATQEKATDGSYKVVRKLYMNTKGKPSKLAQAFIDYICSDAGAEIVRTAGYIPLK
jgi:phosphate transport system substrate-binding protein